MPALMKHSGTRENRDSKATEDFPQAALSQPLEESAGGSTNERS